MKKVWWIKPVDLDKDQMAILAAPSDGKYIVSGPPGSGKSNLLVLRAKHLTTHNVSGFRVLAFNQVLVRFLRASRSVPDKKITTAMAWLEDQLWDLEGERIEEDDFETKRKMLLEAIVKHLRDRNRAELVHTLLIDEFQDYTLEEIAMFERMATNLFMVGDIRQQIYKSDATIASVKELTERFQTTELKFHYRLGRNICTFADRLAKSERGHVRISDGCQYNEDDNPSLVDPPFRGSLTQQVAEVIRRCEVQMDAFRGELIGVLCASNAIIDDVATALDGALPGLITVQQSGEYTDFDESRPVVVSNIHNAKGLEFRCVHIIGAEALKKKPRSRALAYTAVTRGKTRVSFYCEGTMNDFLEDAFMEGSKPTSPAPITALFDE